MGLTSEHFSTAELQCRGLTCGDGHGCHVNGVKQELLDALEVLRTVIGKPITINDAFRCAIHNAQVGGVPDSQHLLGIAADISVPGMTGAELEAAARQVPAINGIGRGANYLHIDTRETPAEWTYLPNGQQAPYYPAG